MDTTRIALCSFSLLDYSLDGAISAALSLGFDAITFHGQAGEYYERRSGLVPPVHGTAPGFDWDSLDEGTREHLIVARRGFARAAIHAPVWDLPIVSCNPSVESEAMRQNLSTIRAAGALALEVVTVHAVPRGWVQEDAFMKRLVANLRVLGEEAERQGTRVGVENVHFPADPGEHADLLSRVDHPAVGATVDVGHVALWFLRDGIARLPEPDGADWFNDRLLRLIDSLGERIVHMHLQDIALPEMNDQHLPPGRGIIDFDAVIKRLGGWGYEGLLELELVPVADIEREFAEARDHIDRMLSPTKTSSAEARP